jgi:hypothetical protein
MRWFNSAGLSPMCFRSRLHPQVSRAKSVDAWVACFHWIEHTPFQRLWQRWCTPLRNERPILQACPRIAMRAASTWQARDQTIRLSTSQLLPQTHSPGLLFSIKLIYLCKVLSREALEAHLGLHWDHHAGYPHRLVTVLTYLTDVAPGEGGETIFPLCNVTKSALPPHLRQPMHHSPNPEPLEMKHADKANSTPTPSSSTTTSPASSNSTTTSNNNIYLNHNKIDARQAVSLLRQLGFITCWFRLIVLIKYHRYFLFCIRIAAPARAFLISVRCAMFACIA